MSIIAKNEFELFVQFHITSLHTHSFVKYLSKWCPFLLICSLQFLYYSSKSQYVLKIWIVQIPANLPGQFSLFGQIFSYQAAIKKKSYKIG